MANNYTEIMKLVNQGNKMGLSNTITRDNGIPLDLSSVYNTYADAVVYAATKSIAYENQVIAAEGVVYVIVGDSQGKLTVGETEYDIYIKPVGTIPGFDTAAEGTLPQIHVDENGNKTLVWVPISAIVEGDGNSVTEVTVDGSLNLSDTKEEGFEGHKYAIGVKISEAEGNSLSVVEDGLFVSVPEITIPGYAITKAETPNEGCVATYRLTKDGTPVQVDIDIPAYEEYDDTELTGKVNAVVSALENIYTKDETDDRIAEEIGKKIHIRTEVVDSAPSVDTAEEGVIYLVPAEDAAAGTYIEYILVSNSDGSKSVEAIGNTATDLSNYYNKTEVDNKFTEHNTAADGKYATKTEVAAHIEEAEGKYATKAYVGTIPSNYTESTVIAYINKKAEETLAAANGGSSETAASVAAALDTHKAENVASFEAVDKQISNIVKDLENVERDAEKNIIEEVKVNGVALVPDENRAVNVSVPTALSGLEGYTEIDERITAAKKAGDDADAYAKALASGPVATNTNDILAIGGRLDTVEGTVGTHTAKIGTFEGQIAGLLAEDEEINTELGKLAAADLAEADARAKEDGRLAGLISGHNTRLDALETKVDLGEGETVKGYVDGKVGAIKGYDDTEVRGLISAEAARADAEEKRIVGLVEAEAARADAAEKANAKAIGELDATLKAALENDGEGLDSIKELAVWIENHETEIIPVINKHTDDIAALTSKVDTGDKNVSAYVADAIAGIPAATASTLGLVKASQEVTVATDGTLGIGFVSTDKLVQGNLTLILDGGDAEVPAN